MTSLVMTEAETAIYENEDENAVRDMLEQLYARAARMAQKAGHPIEILTADGIFAGCADACHLN